MRILGMALLYLGLLCAVAGILSLFFLPRTTLQGVSKTTLIEEIFQDIGYEVTSLEDQGERVDFSIRVPQNTDPAVLEREIDKRLQGKLHPRDTRGMFAGLAGGLILVCLGGVAYRVSSRLHRRVHRKKREQLKALSVIPGIRSNARPTLVASPALPPFLRSPVLPGIVFGGQENHQTPNEEWTGLLDRVRQEMELVQGEVKEALENDFADLLAETRPARRVRKAWHLLNKIEGIREVASQQSSEDQDEPYLSVPSQPALPVPSLELVLKALLPIDEYVPSSLNPEVVRAVICWGFLRPGSRTPFLGGSYTSKEDLNKHVGQIPPDEVRECLRWLDSIGVLIARSHKKAGKRLISLRIRAEGVEDSGNAIILVLREAAYQKARMG